MKAIYIPTDSGEMYCRISGSGMPLILLHGNGEDLSIFQSQMTFFSQYYTVVAIDTRGHGRSERGDTALTFAQLAQDIKTVLDYLHIERTNIIGFSDGGNTALLFAERYPKKIQAMIVVGANVKAEGMNSWELQKVKWSVSFLHYLEKFYSPAKLKREVVDLMFGQLNNTQFKLENIQASTLVMAGENDVIKRNHTKMIARKIKDSQLLIVPKADHFLIMKQADKFNQLALNFLKKH